MSWFYRWIAGGIAGALILALASCRPGAPPVSKPEAPLPNAREVNPPSVQQHEPVPPPPTPPIPSPKREAIETPTGPLMVRVGLASDLSSVDLPCCNPPLVLAAGGKTLPLTEAVRVAPSKMLGERAVFRVQVAALKDELQARGLAERLTKTSGHQADAQFDAGTDLYRVRVGRFVTREQAETEDRRLEALGMRGTWIASEGGALENPALEVILSDKRLNVPGRWLEVSAPADAGVPFDDSRYRGLLLIFLNDRGSLNVVNELDLEDYLRGVVPKEMGPELYNRIEALKAQTVAARTYTVRNLEEFAEEGFDICSTPRCQVYGGMSVEHSLSDRAIAETDGQVVLFGGEPAETLYGATCGGHTEDVEVVFPLKNGPYLRGVPCLESGVDRLAGNTPPGATFPTGLTQNLLPTSTNGKPHRILSGRMEHLALLAGLSVPRDRLRSTAGKEILRFATSIYDLALDRRLRSSREELESLLEDPPRDWRRRDFELASFLVTSPLMSSSGEQIVSDADREQLLFQLALYLNVLERRDTRYRKLSQRQRTVREDDDNQTYDLPANLTTFSLRGETLKTAPLDLMAGDRLELYLHRDRPVALVQPDKGLKVNLRGRVAKQNWSRFVSNSRLRSAVQARYPGFPFEDFEVLSRGVSGRVAKLHLLGSGGKTLLIEGLAIRWTLDVWDNLFWAERSTGQGNEPGWLFRGRGWGHGVGMCQAGTFGMAMRGASYREILEHYYTGIELGRLKPSPERPRFGM